MSDDMICSEPSRMARGVGKRWIGSRSGRSCPALTMTRVIRAGGHGRLGGVMDELEPTESVQLRCTRQVERAIGVVVLQKVQAATVLFSISTKVVNDVSGLRSESCSL
jgi:hypothetical protein